MRICAHVLYCVCPVQLELEMDLIIDQTDSMTVKSGEKVVPAVIKFSDSFTGKIGESMKSIKDKHNGTNDCNYGVIIVTLIDRR